MTTLLEHLSRRLTGTPPAPANMPPITTAPTTQTGQVIFCGFSSGGFDGQGKVDARRFFPAFCKTLHRAGIATYFAHTPQQMLRQLTDDTSLIHIYREIDPTQIDRSQKAMQQVAQAHTRHRGLVYNAPALGRLIARKDLTNIHLTKAGIAVPQMITSSDTDAPVFANDLAGTGAQVAIGYDPDRYNTEFIDTRVPYKGKRYYTTIRLMAVGCEMVRAWVRARDATDGSPSVHARDTPVDAGLYEHLHATLVTPRQDMLRAFARKLGAALGGGFFAHDLLIEQPSERIMICESGYKFDSKTMIGHLQPIRDQIPSLGDLYDDTFAVLSAKAFLRDHRARTV